MTAAERTVWEDAEGSLGTAGNLAEIHMVNASDLPVEIISETLSLMAKVSMP